MSSAKDQIARLEQQRSAAVAIALEVDLLKRCDIHGEVYDPLSNNFEEAYKYGNHLFSQHDPLVAVFESRTEMTDALKNITHDYGDECPDCAKFHAD